MFETRDSIRRKTAETLIEHGIQDRDWKKIEEAAELLNIPTYGAVSIAREQKANNAS